MTVTLADVDIGTLEIGQYLYRYQPNSSHTVVEEWDVADVRQHDVARFGMVVEVTREVGTRNNGRLRIREYIYDDEYHWWYVESPPTRAMNIAQKITALLPEKKGGQDRTQPRKRKEGDRPYVKSQASQ